jgi:hypothetical protein
MFFFVRNRTKGWCNSQTTYNKKIHQLVRRYIIWKRQQRTDAL